MAKSERLIVISPTYNEKGNIERLIKVLFGEVFPQLPSRYDTHLLIVDDSSPDGTGEIVGALREHQPGLHLLSNPTKQGLGGAYVKGMRYALDVLHADIIFEFDADLSHDATKIQPMLEKLAAGYDMVLGSRYIPGGKIPENWGLHRKFLSVMGNLVCRTLVTDFAIHDWTGGFRGLKRHVVESILPEMDREEFTGYTFQIGFLLKARRRKFAVAEVPFHFKDRTLGKSKMPASYIQTTLLFLLRVRLREVLASRIFKFAVVGVIGATVQLTSLQGFRLIASYQLAYFISVELAVVSNFIWSNLWTFKDRTLLAGDIPVKFIQFNVASAGSIVIQQILAFLGERFIGLFVLFSIPIIGITIDTGLTFSVVGILMGMGWNFMAYSKVVWKEKILSK